MTTQLVLVDSDPAVQMSIVESIRENYDDALIYIASNEEEALDALIEHGSGVDAILLSSHLPATDGWELLYILKDQDNWPEIPVVMMVSEESIWDDSLKAQVIGANHFVSKPIKPFELTCVLDTLMKGVRHE